jgi:hypothetical protein
MRRKCSGQQVMIPLLSSLHPKIRNNSWQRSVSDRKEKMIMNIFANMGQGRGPNG